MKIKILYVNGGIMNRGGIESYMMNYYRHIDREKFQIDFIVHGYVFLTFFEVYSGSQKYASRR